jgi:hypothetical protein
LRSQLLHTSKRVRILLLKYYGLFNAMVYELPL